MGDTKTKIDCRLVTRGTDQVKEQVNQDLSIPDPDPVVGKNIIDDEETDGDQSGNS